MRERSRYAHIATRSAALQAAGPEGYVWDARRSEWIPSFAAIYELDFVVDCRADPTGATDCGPALDRAIDLALEHAASPAYAAAYSFTLYVPPGVYKFTTSVGVRNVTNISTIRIVGHRSASIFLVACGDTGEPVLGLANQLSCEIEGITFASLGTTSAPDCAGLLDINSSYLTTFRSVHIRSLIAQSYGIITEGFGSVRFIDCYGDNSACVASTAGLWTVDGARAVSFENFAHIDPGQLNGVSIGPNRLGPHVNTIMVKGTVRHVHFRNTFVDEGCITGIKIGDGTNQIGTVEASELYINPPTLAGKVAGLHVRKARRLVVRGMDHGTFMTVPMIKLESVDRSDLENIRKQSGSSAYVITADAASGYLRIADMEGFAAAAISAGGTPAPNKFTDVLGTITGL